MKRDTNDGNLQDFRQQAEILRKVRIESEDLEILMRIREKYLGKPRYEGKVIFLNDYRCR